MPCERKHVEAIERAFRQYSLGGCYRPSPNDALAAISAAFAACDESPWRSMESAPMDGTKVDLTDGADRCTDCQWSYNHLDWVYWGSDGYDCFGWVKIAFVPKGWTPLPAAPEVGK